MAAAAPEAEYYCTDGYQGYLDVIYPGKHIYNIQNKRDTFTAESVNADLRRYVLALVWQSRCFPRKPENLQAILAVFVQAYNRFGFRNDRYRSRHPGAASLSASDLSISSFSSRRLICSLNPSLRPLNSAVEMTPSMLISSRRSFFA